MKKDVPYRDQLIELSKLYKIPEIKSYLRSKKHLTTSQIELILLKNKIPLPAHSYNRKKIAEIKFKEQVATNVVLTLVLLGFITSLMGIRPYIKVVTNEIKFTHIAKEYKSNFKYENKFPETSNKTKNLKPDGEDVSLDTKITLNLFEDLKYDLKGIRSGALVKPIYLSKLPKDLKKLKSTQKKKDTFIKIVMPLILDENNKIFPELLHAQQRGVIIDTAMGRFNFAFDVASRALEQGVRPDTLATDLTIPGRRDTVHSMTEMMTRFLALGFKLSDVIAMASTNAAKALNMDASMGSLREGRLADISVLSQESGKWVVKDCSGEELSTDQALSPWVTLREGEVFMPDWGPHPWGWLPEKAD